MCLALGKKIKGIMVREQKRCPLYRTSDKTQCEDMATPPPFPWFLHKKHLLMPQQQRHRPHEGGSRGYIELSTDSFSVLLYLGWESWLVTLSLSLRRPQQLFGYC